jgi:ribokinase
MPAKYRHSPGRVVALGDVNVDVIAHFATFPTEGKDAFARTSAVQCGGSAANAAIALARLGIETSLIARVGADLWAEAVLQTLGDAGVALSSLQRDPLAMTGLMYVVVTPDGERTILGHRAANVYTDPEQIGDEQIRGASWLHLSGYALLAEPQRSAALRAWDIAHSYGLAVSLDPGMCVSEVALGEMRARLPRITLLLPSLAEAQALSGQTAPEDCAWALMAAGAHGVALKLGRQGCLVARAGEISRLPGFVVETCDSTGAGDSFAAGLIAGFLWGLDWPAAALLGNAMGALASARVGAGAALSGAAEALVLLHEQHDAPMFCSWREAMDQVAALLIMLATRSKEEDNPWQT